MAEVGIDALPDEILAKVIIQEMYGVSVVEVSEGLTLSHPKVDFFATMYHFFLCKNPLTSHSLITFLYIYL